MPSLIKRKHTCCCRRSEHGNWEAWLDFFLTGVADTANQAFDAATHIVDVFKEDRERITTESDRAGSALRIHDLFQQNPFLTANQLVQRAGLSAPTVNAALADLERSGVVEEVTGRKRGRVFSYRRYLAILSEGTDPLPSTILKIATGTAPRALSTKSQLRGFPHLIKDFGCQGRLVLRQNP
ncbi:Fic family domain-containing protein (plasmid) [Rhizobium gallicum bv. gallicum R602sp]|uniref:Fic family domain-containing protein n=1 Tax=Rhizobium gallicum bv. gallicum R602sp TaxID=1041138 RepID=A0A0B4XHN2_9HYPH|nr:Fic family domain-containing protein [Rhizobium gallicum bv. gallicum R602sp]